VSGVAEIAAMRGERPVALVDGRNVQRSSWPNVSDEDLVRRTCAWARSQGTFAVIVFDGRTAAEGDGEACVVVPVIGETADEWLVRAAQGLAELDVPFVLVTSDRELRSRAGARAERVVGGGRFLRGLP
jgi:hypothetical protein